MLFAVNRPRNLDVAKTLNDVVIKSPFNFSHANANIAFKMKIRSIHVILGIPLQKEWYLKKYLCMKP